MPSEMTDTPQTDVLGDPKASHKELVDGLDRVKPKPQTDELESGVDVEVLLRTKIRNVLYNNEIGFSMKNAGERTADEMAQSLVDELTAIGMQLIESHAKNAVATAENDLDVYWNKKLEARELEIKKEAYNRGYNSGYVGAKKGRSNKKDASFKAYIEKLVDDRIEELESKKKST